MGIQNKGGRWIFVKRVPKRFQHVDSRTFARIALNTDSKSEAERKAPAIEAEVMAFWEALAAGQGEDAQRRYDAARTLAEAHGFQYMPLPDVINLPFDQFYDRLGSAYGFDPETRPKAITDAVMGRVPVPSTTISTAFDEFFDFTEDRRSGRSESQIKLWRNERARIIRYFIDAVDDLPMHEITREHALKFRRWWQDKIASEQRDPGTANKAFGIISDVFQTWSELKGLHVENPFKGLLLKASKKMKGVPFSTTWIKSRLLAPGALEGLNTPARDALLVMINTGARPAEIIDALGDDFHVDAEIPFLCIRAHEGRTLKTEHSEREIPLMGVSLEAATRLRETGGCLKYQGKASAWSAVVNKFLRANGLRETDNHTAYSLRHAFEDRLLESGVDERVRVELMGHKYNRPAYGSGGSLNLKRDAIVGIAL